MDIQEFLKNSVGVVRFAKTDGTERTMRCTLKYDIIEQHAVPYERKRPPENQITRNENVLRVFDLDKNAWRSFRLDSVLDVDAA